VTAFFINVGLLVFANCLPPSGDAFDLQVLSFINMILLSFALLRDTKPKSE